MSFCFGPTLAELWGCMLVISSLASFTFTIATAVYTEINSSKCMIWLYSRSQLCDAVYSFSLFGSKLNFFFFQKFGMWICLSLKPNCLLCLVLVDLIMLHKKLRIYNLKDRTATFISSVTVCTQLTRILILGTCNGSGYIISCETCWLFKTYRGVC